MTDQNGKKTTKPIKELESERDYTTNLLWNELTFINNLLNETGIDFSSQQTRINELKNRLISTRFHLAVLGQFKRGKSTLLNALLGKEILPSAIIPITSIPTFLSWGSEMVIKVVFQNGNIHEYCPQNTNDACSFLTQYVTETHNPKNKLNISKVEISYPSPLLEKGVVLIDTPGIGSTLQHNTEITLNFLPQCDGALFLISADPPITQVETDFLKAVHSKVTKIFFVINKVDYLGKNEIDEAMNFLKLVLHEQLGLNNQEPIFTISARQGMQARITGTKALWIDSGMASLEDYLVKFLTEEKLHSLQLAVAKKAVSVLEDSLLQIRLMQYSLMVPLEDLDKKLEIFNQKLDEIEQQRILAQDILKGEQKRLIEMLEAECTAMIKRAEEKLFTIMEEVLHDNKDISSIENIVHNRLTEEVPDLFDNNLFRIRESVNNNLKKVLGKYKEKTQTLANVIRHTASQLFDVPYTYGNISETLEIHHEPYWITENWNINLSPLPHGWLEKILPKKTAVQRIKRSIQQDIESIVLRNVGNLRWATVQNIQDTFYRFSLNMDQELKEIAKITQDAIYKARDCRLQKVGNVEQEISRLKYFEMKLQNIQSELSKF